MKTGTGEAIPDLSHISTDITDQVSITHIMAVPDHDIGIINTITEVGHHAQDLHTGVTAINPTMTHHIYHTTDLNAQKLIIPLKRSKSLTFMPILQILERIYT